MLFYIKISVFVFKKLLKNEKEGDIINKVYMCLYASEILNHLWEGNIFYELHKEFWI